MSSRPVVEVNAGIYSLHWEQYNLAMRIDRLRERADSVSGEIVIRSSLPGQPSHLHQARLNLTSTTARRQLATFLTERYGSPPPWGDVLEQTCVMVLAIHREGDPPVFLSQLPRRETLRYRVDPLLVEKQANMVYGAGRTGKSMLAVYLSILVESPLNHNGLTVEPGKVLYLDYETDEEEVAERVRALQAGIGVETPTDIIYRFGKLPLADDIEQVQHIVADHRINLVVVDSMGMAAGGDQDKATDIIRYFQALRTLRCTTLTLHHINKEGKMYGNVYAYNEARCYAADTEVLTPSGWKLHSELPFNEPVAAFDQAYNCLRWEIPCRIWSFDYTGPMVEINHKSTSASITPDHRVWVSSARQRSPSFAFLPAERLLKNRWIVQNPVPMRNRGKHNGRISTRYQIQKGMHWVPLNAFLRFVGYWISEGSINRNSVILSQKKPGTLERMRDVCRQLGFAFTDTTTSTGVHNLILDTAAGQRFRKAVAGIQRPLASWLREQCGEGARQKHLPPFVFSLRRAHIGTLLESLMEGDGHIHNANTGIYYTASERLAGEVQALAILLGYSATVGSRTRDEKYAAYQVSITKKRARIALSPDTVSLDYYSGKVYCLTVPSGAYVTRRKGKVGIHGNCIWESKAVAEPGSDHLDIGLYHRKMNNGRLAKPLGFRITFGQDAYTVTKQDLRAVPELEAGLTLRQRLAAALSRGAMSVEDLAQEVSVTEASVRMTLNRHKAMFQPVYTEGKRDHAWGLRSVSSDTYR